MTKISLAEFQDWRKNAVTKAFLFAAQERIHDAMHVLSTTAGMNSVEDNYMRGFIQAYRELEDFRIDDLDGSTDE
jgi:hypothetical protein